MDNKARILELRELLHRHNHNYYVLNSPTIGDIEFDIFDEADVSYHCDCTRQRVEKAVVSVGKDELMAMANDGKDIEVTCQFCDKVYKFTPEQLEKIRREADENERRAAENPLAAALDAMADADDEDDDKLFDEESVFEGDLAVVEEGEE